MRGRKPKPTELKKLEGNPGKRPLNANEPKPRPFRPQKPDWLDSEASAKWDKMIPILEHMRTLTEADGDILAQYCTAYSNWERCEKIVQQLQPVHAFTAKSGDQYITQNPAYIMALKLNQLVARLGELLGLNPSARSRISVTELPDEEVEDLLFGGQK